MTFAFIAHRGASADAPENTAQAFHLALQQQADMIETDIQVTQDGVLVLVHDPEIKGQLVAASRTHELYTLHPQMQTLAAALRDFSAHIPFCWEIKAAGIEAAAVQLIRDLTPDAMWPRTQFTSFMFGSALQVRQHAPDAIVGWLTKRWDEATIRKTAEAGLNQICPPAETLLQTPQLVQTAHEAGLQVRVWLVTSPQLIPGLIAAGVSGGTVNWPAQARQAAI